MWFEDAQKELLAKFVEAHRSAPHDLRGEFIVVDAVDSPQPTFMHSRTDTRFDGSLGDAEALALAGLLKRSLGPRGQQSFYVLPRGVQFYEEMRGSVAAVEAVETEITRFLSAPELKAVHGAASEKWEQAASLLWSADSENQLTTIGHLCREALQEFAASLARRHGVDVSSTNPAHTVTRLRAIIKAKTGGAGAAEAELLDALVCYWGCVSDLVQRQEHGSQREGAPLTWEDARRVVFQSCVLMFEVARALR